MHSAAANGDMEALQRLLDARADLEAKDSDGRTALAFAAEGGHAEALQRLLDAHADLEAKDNERNTALACAALLGYAEALQRLLDARADVEAKAHDGSTALAGAARFGNTEALQRLLDANANKEAKDNDGRTALAWAASEGRMEALQRLLAANANKEAKDSSGRTALIWATSEGHMEALQRLLAAHAKTDAKDSSGNTALVFAARGTKGLHYAAASMRVDMVRLLLQAGADPRRRNEEAEPEELDISAIKMGNVCGANLLEGSFRDVSKRAWNSRLFQILGPARSSTEGPRAWDIVCAAGAEMSRLRDWFKDVDYLITATPPRLLGWDDLFGKHVTPSVPISHFASRRGGLPCMRNKGLAVRGTTADLARKKRPGAFLAVLSSGGRRRRKTRREGTWAMCGSTEATFRATLSHKRKQRRGK